MLKKSILYLLYSLIIVGLVLAIIFAFDDKAQAPPPSKPIAQPVKPVPPAISRQAQPSRSPSHTSGSSPRPRATQPANGSANASSSQANTPQPNALVNTGPGEVMAVFSFGVMIGAGLYRRQLLRSAV